MDSADRDRPEAAPIVLARVRPFTVGAVQVRPATREVVGPRGREVLEPRVMEVLVALARARGEIVTRDDLIASCWDGRIVGEDAITRVISRLRRTSEGVGADGWTLETITKVGYRLLPTNGQFAEAVTSAPGAAALAKPSRRALILAGAGVAATAAIAGGIYWRLRKPPVSPQAKALYEKGREALRQGLADPTAQAIGFLREAVAEQPDYADAWGALSHAYQISLTFTEPARQDEVTAQAGAAANRALDLDPDQPDASATLALLAPVYRNWATAEPLYVRALAAHPGEASVEAGYARLTLGLGRIAAAVKAAQASVDGDPYVPAHRQILGLALWAAGRAGEAQAVVAKALTLWPRHYALWFLHLHLLTDAGHTAEALAFAANVGRRPAGIPESDVDLALTVVRALRTRAPADIEAAAAANLEGARRGVGYAEVALRALSALGRLDDTFTVARSLYLNEGGALGSQRYSAVQGRYSLVGSRSSHHLFLPPTAPMRADPRFPTLMRDMGIAAYWKASGRGPDQAAWARAA